MYIVFSQERNSQSGKKISTYRMWHHIVESKIVMPSKYNITVHWELQMSFLEKKNCNDAVSLMCIKCEALASVDRFRTILWNLLLPIPPWEQSAPEQTVSWTTGSHTGTRKWFRRSCDSQSRYNFYSYYLNDEYCKFTLNYFENEFSVFRPRKSHGDRETVFYRLRKRQSTQTMLCVWSSILG